MLKEISLSSERWVIVSEEHQCPGVLDSIQGRQTSPLLDGIPVLN